MHKVLTRLGYFIYNLGKLPWHWYMRLVFESFGQLAKRLTSESLILLSSSTQPSSRRYSCTLNNARHTMKWRADYKETTYALQRSTFSRLFPSCLATSSAFCHSKIFFVCYMIQGESPPMTCAAEGYADLSDLSNQLLLALDQLASFTRIRERWEPLSERFKFRLVCE